MSDLHIDILAKQIIEHKFNLDHCRKSIQKERLLLKRNTKSLLSLMNEQSLKTFENQELDVKIINSVFVDIDDKNLVPENYKVSLGFRINKSKIRKEGKAPEGTSFRSRQNLNVFKK